MNNSSQVYENKASDCTHAISCKMALDDVTIYSQLALLQRFVHLNPPGFKLAFYCQGDAPHACRDTQNVVTVYVDGLQEFA